MGWTGDECCKFFLHVHGFPFSPPLCRSSGDIPADAEKPVEKENGEVEQQIPKDSEFTLDEYKAMQEKVSSHESEVSIVSNDDGTWVLVGRSVLLDFSCTFLRIKWTIVLCFNDRTLSFHLSKLIGQFAIRQTMNLDRQWLEPRASPFQALIHFSMFHCFPYSKLPNGLWQVKT